MKSLPSLFIFFLIPFCVLSQQNVLSERDYIIRYKKAVQLYANQDYLEAKELFVSLTSQKYNNAMVPYAHFYYGLCSFELGNYQDTRAVLRQLFERFPDWNKLDEAYYLYANASFADNNIEDGMQMFNRISMNNIRKDIENMQYYYFGKITDRSRLKQLNQKYPNNSIIAKFLVDNIQKSKSVTREELELSDLLTNKFRLQTSTPKKVVLKPETRGTVNVAVLLPFRLPDYNPAKSSFANQYIFDMYEGFKLAQEKLKADQINVNLFAFDVERDVNLVENLVNNDKFSQIDLVIGPLYPDANRVINNFTRSNDIIQVHPLSNNQQLVHNEKFTFLATPSYEVQATKALNFMGNRVSSKSVAIYFGNTRKDSTFAYIYRDKAISKGYTISTIKRFTNAEDIDSQKKAGHIFISGSDGVIGSKILNAIDKKKVTAPTIASSSAFNFETTSLNVFDRALYLIQLDYIDRDKEEVKNFRSQYFAEQNIAPSYYSYLGYDILLFYAQMLNKGKTSLRTALNAIEYTQGYNLDGFDYTNGSNENQLVPIIKFEDGHFVEVR